MDKMPRWVRERLNKALVCRERLAISGIGIASLVFICHLDEATWPVYDPVFLLPLDVQPRQ